MITVYSYKDGYKIQCQNQHEMSVIKKVISQLDLYVDERLINEVPLDARTLHSDANSCGGDANCGGSQTSIPGVDDQSGKDERPHQATG